MSDTDTDERRRFPGPVTGLVVVALLGAMMAIRRLDLLGDPGLANALSAVLVLAAGAILLGWFVLRSAWPARVRFGVLAGIGIVVVAGLALLRLEGVSGAMVPRLAFRFSASPEVPALPASPATDVDLAATTPDDFPGFLGPDRDLGVDHVRLSRDWSDPPELLWRRPVGAGWSAFAVVNGFAVTLEQRGDREVVTCYEAATGEPCWSFAMAGRYEDVIAGTGPRSTPTIAGGSVYALGATGTLVALDGRTGEPRWKHDLLELSGMSREQERALLPYGRANSPLVVDDLVVVPLGGPGPPDDGRAGLVALRTNDGRVAWRSPPRQISMASPTVATLAGVRQILTVNEASVSGHDPADGALLWEHPWPGSSAGDANVSQPVPLPPDRVFLSKGYGRGAALLRLQRLEHATLQPQEIWQESRVLRTKLTNVVVHEGFVYGLSEGILECVDLETGQRVWKHGRYHHGQILRVGDLLLVLTEEGELVLVEATPERPDHVLGRFQALEGPTWNNLALYGDILLVRNAREAAAYRLPVAATE